MRVRVREVLDRAAGVVAFSCAYGSATAVWRGAEPAVPGLHHAELDVAPVGQRARSRTAY